MLFLLKKMLKNRQKQGEMSLFELLLLYIVWIFFRRSLYCGQIY